MAALFGRVGAMIDRRKFFKYSGGALIALTVPAKIKTPTIYCDGTHCDAEGLSALLNGDVFTFANIEFQKIYMSNNTNPFVINFDGLPPLNLSEPFLLPEAGRHILFKNATIDSLSSEPIRLFSRRA